MSIPVMLVLSLLSRNAALRHPALPFSVGAPYYRLFLVFTRLPTRFLRFLPALLLVALVQRDVNGEACALSLAAFHLHPAVVALDDLLHHGQADAQAAALARASRVARQKRENTIFASSGVRPMPVSCTLMDAMMSPRFTRTVTKPPSDV